MTPDLTEKIHDDDYHWIARGMLRDGYTEEEILAGTAIHLVLDLVGFDLSTAPRWPHADFPRCPTRKHEVAWREVLDIAIRDHPDLRMLVLEVAERMLADRDHIRHKIMTAYEMIRKYSPEPEEPTAEDIREWYRQKARERASS